MNYENAGQFTNNNESELMKFFEVHSNPSNHLAVEVSHFETIHNEINNNFEDLIKKILAQDSNLFDSTSTSSMSLASSSSSASSASSSSSLFNIGYEETRKNDQILRPLQLNVSEAKNKSKTNALKSSSNSFNENNKENSLGLTNTLENSNSLKTAFRNNSLNSMQTSCKNLIFKSLNSSNTIFIQPHDVLTPLNEGEFHEYKLFPIVQN